MKLFSPDSLIMRWMALIADFILLNLLVILFSIPIVTCPAAITALYTVIWRIVRVEDYAVSDFFKAFKANFKPATAAAAILVIGAAALYASYSLAEYFSPVAQLIIYLVTVVLGAMLLLTVSWVFPMISQFDNSTSRTLVNSFFLAVGKLPRTIIITAINLVPWALLIFYPTYFFWAGFVWFMGWFSASAYFNILLMNKEVKNYRIQILGEDVPDMPEPEEYNNNYVDDSAWAALQRFYNAEDDLKPEEELEEEYSDEESAEDAQPHGEEQNETEESEGEE